MSRSALVSTAMLLLVPVIFGIGTASIVIARYKLKQFIPEDPPLIVFSAELLNPLITIVAALGLSLWRIRVPWLARIPLAGVVGCWALARCLIIEQFFVDSFAYCCC